MTLFTELLAALPAGAAEAVAARGIDSIARLIRRDADADEWLADDLDSIAIDESPSRPILEVADKLAKFVEVTVDVETHNESAVRQEAGDGSSLIAFGNAGRDIHVHDPHRPNQR